MKLIQSILRGDLQFSAEEIEAEEQVVVGLIDEAPANVGEIEDDFQDEQDLSDEVSEISDELIQVGEVEQSLEGLVELLKMEAKPLTGREYAMVMASANSMLQRAGLESESFTVEDAEVEQEHDRGSVASAIGDKAKAVGGAIVAAIKKIWAKMGEWWDMFFNNVTKARKRLVALAAVYTKAQNNEFECELPATFQKVMGDDVYTNLSKAYQDIMVNYVKQLGNLALSSGKRMPLHLNTPATPSLPGAPAFTGIGPLRTLDEIREHCTFAVKESLTGEGDAFSVKMGKSFARSSIGQMISFCDLLLRAKNDWKRMKDIIDREMTKDGNPGGERWMTLRAVGIFYDIGPKNFVKYAGQVMMMRAKAYAIVAEKISAPAAKAAPEAAAKTAPKGQLAIGHTA